MYYQLIYICSMLSAAPHLRLVQDGSRRWPLGRRGPPPAGPRDPRSTGSRRLHHARHAHWTHHGARLHGRREGGRHDQTRLGLHQLTTWSPLQLIWNNSRTVDHFLVVLKLKSTPKVKSMIRKLVRLTELFNGYALFNFSDLAPKVICLDMALP